MNLDALSSHICIDAVNHELVDRAANKGLTAFDKALKIVNITKALTMFVAISPTRPLMGNIRVHKYNAIVIGIKPIGFFNAFIISSSTFESVFSANRLKEFIMTEIIKPLKRNAESTTSNDEIIAPRLIPKKPLFQTSDRSFYQKFGTEVFLVLISEQ